MQVRSAIVSNQRSSPCPTLPGPSGPGLRLDFLAAGSGVPGHFLFALVTGSDALPGDFLKVRVEGVGEQFDLVCTPDDGTAS